MEKVLLEHAHTHPPAVVRELARHIKARLLDEDDATARQEKLHANRWLDAATTFEGAVAIKGVLDPVAGQTVLAALAAYTTGPDPQGATDGGAVGRTAAQRRADALTEICAHALANPDRGDDGGDRPHVHVTVPLETLQAELGEDTEPRPSGGSHHTAAGASHRAAAHSGAAGGCDRAAADGAGPAGAGDAHGAAAAVAHLFASTPPALLGPGREPICAQTARRLACDAGIIPVVLGSHAEPLDIGRLTRTVPTGLRRALVLRDGGCRFPGCDRPAGWCDAHHLHAWADGGPTSLANLALLCARHHTLVHEGGWRLLINPTTAHITAYRPGGARHDLTSAPRGPTRGP